MWWGTNRRGVRAARPALVKHAPAPSSSSRAGLDWLNFFIANVQTGFGPFISVYLTTQQWTQVDIGLVLTVSGAFALLGQVPAGVLIDAMASKRLAAAIGVVAIAGSALMLAAWPIFPLVLVAELLHGVASCLVAPAIAAISLGLVSRTEIGERLGRNACFASIGNGLAAALMGACGRLLSTRSVFVLAAALAIPALAALRHIKPADIDRARARGGKPEARPRTLAARLHGISDNKPLLIFGGCLILFHLANGAMLPLMASVVTMRSREWATVLIAACIVAPQLLVAVLSPWIGRRAEAWGRWPLLLAGFAALAIRGGFFIFVSSPYLLVAVQVLDGVSAAVMGVMLPLVVADTTRGTGRFNAALGVVGTAGAIGAALSTTLAGYISDDFGSRAAFICLAGIAAAGALMVAGLMPETRPTRD